MLLQPRRMLDLGLLRALGDAMAPPRRHGVRGVLDYVLGGHFLQAWLRKLRGLRLPALRGLFVVHGAVGCVVGAIEGPVLRRLLFGRLPLAALFGWLPFGAT